jgi:hypothetical protein
MWPAAHYVINPAFYSGKEGGVKTLKMYKHEAQNKSAGLAGPTDEKI